MTYFASAGSDINPETIALAHIERLFGTEVTGNLVVMEAVPTGKVDENGKPKTWMKHTHFDATTERQSAVAYAVIMSARHNTYLAWATHNGERAVNDKGRLTRKVESAEVIPGFALDIDLTTGTHAATNLPRDEHEALQRLAEAGLPCPTGIIRSGGGLYPMWLFHTPFVIQSEEDRARIAAATKAFELKARQPFHVAGQKLDSVGELARVFRIPGMTNAKYGKMVTVASWNDAVRYSLDELEKAAPSVPAIAKRSGKVTETGTIEEELKASGVEGMDKVLNVLKTCRFAKRCVEIAEARDKIPEPLWKHLADTLGHLGAAGTLAFHLISQQDSRYSQREADAKLQHARQFKPKRCETIAADCGECARCPFRFNGKMASPITLATGGPNLLRLQTDWVLDARTGLHFSPDSGRDKTKDDFDRSFAWLFPEDVPSNVFKRSRLSLVVDEHDYRAGVDELVILEGHNLILNTWRRGGVIAKSGDCEVILDHLRFLFPVERELAHVLCYLAHLARYPGVKIHHFVMVKTAQGVGKNALEELLRTMLGSHNVSLIFGAAIEERFNPELGNNQVLIVDELDLADKASAYNKFKRWITADTQRVERKGVDKYMVRTPRGGFVFTNRDLSIRIEKSDRRLFMVKNDAKPRGPEYYKRLFEAVNDPDAVAAFRAYLDEVDLTAWSPTAHPPETEAKRDLERLSAPALEQEILAMREDEDGPFCRPVYTVAEVAQALRERLRTNVTTQAVEAIVSALGDEPIKARPTVCGRKLRLWCWKDHDDFRAATSPEVGLLFRPGLPLSDPSHVVAAV